MRIFPERTNRRESNWEEKIHSECGEHHSIGWGGRWKKKWEKSAQLMLTPFPSASVTAAVTVHSWPLLLHSSHAGSYQWISRKLLDFNFGLRPSLPTSPPLWGFWLFGVGNYWTEQLLGSKVSQYIKFELTSNHISQSTKKKFPYVFLFLLNLSLSGSG